VSLRKPVLVGAAVVVAMAGVVADAVADEAGAEPTSLTFASASTSTSNGTASARTKRLKSTRYAKKLPKRSGPLPLKRLKKRNRTSTPETTSARTRTRSATDSSTATTTLTLMSSLPTTTPTPRRGELLQFQALLERTGKSTGARSSRPCAVRAGWSLIRTPTHAWLSRAAVPAGRACRRRSRKQ
jgi:hypothetical protein